LDFSSLVGYGETLAMLYAWTLLAAAAFAIGEALLRKKPPAPETTADRPAS
jgi:hypothetical protein